MFEYLDAWQVILLTLLIASPDYLHILLIIKILLIHCYMCPRVANCSVLHR